MGVKKLDWCSVDCHNIPGSKKAVFIYFIFWTIKVALLKQANAV